jgi:cytoskeletal protein CcmA (bactofilin family)
MFNSVKKRTEAAQAIHTLLGKGTLWKGEIHAGSNSLRIEGTVEGTIHSDGEVTIAPSGEVKGTINAKHLIVTGKVLGNFNITECLEIHGTGCVEGEVEVGNLVVDEGGILQGNCTRRGRVPEETAPIAPREAPAPAATAAPSPSPAPSAPAPAPAAAAAVSHPSGAHGPVGPAANGAHPPVGPSGNGLAHPGSTHGAAASHPSVGPSRPDDLPTDRHVFNLAPGLPNHIPGDHAYSKTKL